MKKLLFSIAVIFCMFLLSTSAPAAGGNDTVKVGVAYDSSTVNMLEMKLGYDLPVILCMHETLIAPDLETGELTMGLAKSMEVMPNKKDIKITLRKGPVFHTGDPLTAHDVKWTYEQCINPENANVMAGTLDEIEPIEILDDYSFIFHLWEPYAAWKELMWIGICSKKYYDKVGRETFRRKPVGSGIFRFVERRMGESVTLEVVPNHHGYRLLKEAYGIDPPNFRYLKFVTVPDAVTRLSMLETGELDLVTAVLPHQLKRLERNPHIIIKKTGRVPSLFGVSVRPFTHPIMKDKKLKRAMNHAINRQEIIDKIFLGEGYPLYMYASKSEPGDDPEVSYAFDPEKARELVKQSTYVPGTPLPFTYTNETPNCSLVAQAVQKYLGDVGITVKLQQLEAGTAATYSRNKDKRAGPLVLFSWGGGRDPSTRLLLTISSKGGYCSYPDRPNREEMDKWCMAQARETDETKRRAILKKIHDCMIDDPGSIILFGLNMIYAMRDRIEYSWTPNDLYAFNLYTIKIVK